MRRLALALVLLAPARAAAHQPGLSRAEVRIGPGRIDLELVFARPEIVRLAPGADADRDGQLGELELLSVETLLSEQVLEGIRAGADGAACAGTIERIAFVEEDGLSVAAGFTCPGARGPAEVSLAFPLLTRLAPGHRLLGRARFGDLSSAPDADPPDALDFVAHARRSAVALRRPAPDAPPAPAPAPAAPAREAPAPARWPWLALAAAPLVLGAWAFRRRRRSPYSRAP